MTLIASGSGKLRLIRDRVLYGGNQARERLTSAGIDDLEAAFSAGERVLKGRHDHKEVTRLCTSRGERTGELYIKRQNRRVRLLPRFRDLLEHGPFAGDPRKEWYGLNLLRSWGLHAAEPLALIYRPFSFRSAIVTSGVPGKRSLREMAREGALEALTDDQMEALSDAIVRTVNEIHNHGYGWRGMDAKHLYPAATDDGGFRIWLIDCEGVHRSRSRVTVDRDLGRLLGSLEKADAPQRLTESLKRKLGRF